MSDDTEKLYRVRIIYDLVAVADSETDAELEYRTGPPRDVIRPTVDATPITSADDLPSDDWADGLPWGGDGQRTVKEYLEGDDG